MKLALAALLSIVLVFIGIRAFSFWAEERDLRQSVNDVNTRLMAAKNDAANLQAETEYLSNPANLEKELRAEFNYAKPGEKMIVIVPAQTSSTGR